MPVDPKNIVLLGAGGHASVLAELIKAAGEYKIYGYFDPNMKKGLIIEGVPVLGSDGHLALVRKKVRNACIAVGSIHNTSVRRRLFKKAKSLGFKVPFLIHPRSIVASTVDLTEGAQIMAGVVLQPHCRIGENTIINTGSIIEHDCLIGSDVHICPGTVVSGGCSVEDGAFIGSGAVVIQGIKIGRNAVVGAGSVVIKDVPAGEKVCGVPAKVLC